MKKLIGLLMIFSVLMFASCEKVSYYQIPGTSEQFSKDTYKVILAIQKDINNKTNATDSYIKNSITYKYFQKYKNTNLTSNEKRCWN